MCLNVWCSCLCVCAAALTLATVNCVEMIQWWHKHTNTYTCSYAWSAFYPAEKIGISKSIDRATGKKINLQIIEWKNKLHRIWLEMETKIDLTVCACVCVWICANLNDIKHLKKTTNLFVIQINKTPFFGFFFE